ncbi:MAG: glycosyltransferase involved in cell wall biosynthesis [Planctomycetota bacterium]|jgi:glycosyltransferase involved in cell wall biosynthesis
MDTLGTADGTAGTGLDVGILCQGWFPDAGGVESHTRDLARDLISRGHRVHVLCLDYSPDRDPYSTRDLEVDGVQVRRMAYLYQDHRALADVVENRRAEDVLYAWLAEHPVDVVHVHHLTGWGLGALRAIHGVGRPCVMTLHDYWPLCPRGQMMTPDRVVCAQPKPDVCAQCIASTWGHLMPSRGGELRGPDSAVVTDDESAAAERTQFALECLSLPERLVTPSRRARAVFVRAGIHQGHIAVVENGVDVKGLVAQVKVLREQSPNHPGGLRIGALGTVLPSKGQLELAHAFLEANVPQATLEIYGAIPAYHGDESYVNELGELAKKHHTVRLHGPYVLDDLPRILSELDAVVANSRWEEVYGLTVREASAVGLPVLVSDAGDLGSVTQGGAAGMVVEVDDHAGWVDAFWTLHNDADAMRRWRESPRRVHTTEAMVVELLAVYGDAIRRAGGDVLEVDLGLVAEEGGNAPKDELTTPRPVSKAAEPDSQSLLWRLLHRRKT